MIIFFVLEPPKRLMLLHFLPTFFCVSKWVIFRLYFNTVVIIIITSTINFICFCSAIISNSYFYFFTFCKCLYNRQQLFCFLSIHLCLYLWFNTVFIQMCKLFCFSTCHMEKAIKFKDYLMCHPKSKQTLLRISNLNRFLHVFYNYKYYSFYI